MTRHFLLSLEQTIFTRELQMVHDTELGPQQRNIYTSSYSIVPAARNEPLNCLQPSTL